MTNVTFDPELRIRVQRTPTISELPLVIGEILRRHHARKHRHAQRTFRRAIRILEWRH
jgi:hypothetical protein